MWHCIWFVCPFSDWKSNTNCTVDNINAMTRQRLYDWRFPHDEALNYLTNLQTQTKTKTTTTKDRREKENNEMNKLLVTSHQPRAIAHYSVTSSHVHTAHWADALPQWHEPARAHILLFNDQWIYRIHVQWNRIICHKIFTIDVTDAVQFHCGSGYFIQFFAIVFAICVRLTGDVRIWTAINLVINNCRPIISDLT